MFQNKLGAMTNSDFGKMENLKSKSIPGSNSQIKQTVSEFKFVVCMPHQDRPLYHMRTFLQNFNF